MMSVTNVNVYHDQDKLAHALCNDFVSSAKNEISKKGSFYVAVPGGSVLKMLGGKRHCTPHQRTISCGFEIYSTH
jgi:hypothetical protein